MNHILKSARLLLAILMIGVWPSESSAQNDFQEGYIVTTSNDTLYGLVKDRKTGSFSGLFRKIRFKGKRGKRKYSPKEVQSYTRGGNTFETFQLIGTGRFFDDDYRISANGEYQYLRVVEKGYLSYYLLEYEEDDSSYVDTIAYFKKNNEDRFIRVNQGLFGLKRKKLSSYFSDCPELAERIQNKKVKHPIDIVHFYNKWKADSL
ncbi:hypothetical protein [Maribacter sp. 2307UL18-2]|uniref:hypothetical protein n=1 Tax=Maribacter sp. 2307UL18-2 TaxID=3386274 RepID=UPI0039BC77D9